LLPQERKVAKESAAHASFYRQPIEIGVGCVAFATSSFQLINFEKISV